MEKEQKELTIEEIPSGQSRMRTMRIGGFGDGELRELKMLRHSEAENRLIDLLDERNGNTGTCWCNGPGVWGIWFDNEYAYVNVGSSCD